MEKAKLQEHEKFKSIAKQVAHDIRSPLTALDVMMGYMTQLPEKDRLVIRNSAQRINDIANNLLSRYSDTSGRITNDTTEIKTTELFITMLESILSEKKMQYANKSVEFTISFASEARSLFANVNLSAFNRVLSNIINNAAEAFDENKKGSIQLVLSQNQKNILLSIIDNGKGISAAKLQQLFVDKQSNKQGGHGLGLPYAKECIEKWHGKLNIESTEGLGTVIKISLPKAQMPKWFAPKIQLTEGITIAILDDDNSIHDVWRSRFGEAEARIKNLPMVNFLTIDSLKQWHQQNTQSTMFLVDYELLGVELTGFDVIEQLKIVDKSILVTSHFEDLKIRERCEKLELKMIPKSFSPYIPIELRTKSVALENS